MTLYKQIVGVITLFLLLMSGFILWFVLNYNKTLIEEQMASNAKNSAAFLGLSISKNLDIEDTASIEGMLSSILDNGFYEYIAVYDVDDKEVVKISSPREVHNLPVWFTNVFSIDAPSSISNVMKGWSNKGTIEVKIHQDFANNQMWETFVSVSQIFLLGIAGLLVLIYFVLNKLLEPLKKLSIQAKAIDNNEFIIENDLPQTVEFKNVVHAMNKTIGKMEAIFNKEVETLNKYNELLYKDRDTGLGNRKYLLLKLDTYLKNSHGLLMFFELKDEVSFKKAIGYQRYSAFKQMTIGLIRESFKENKDLVLSKLDDGTIAVLHPNKYYDDIEKMLVQIDGNIKKYIQNEALNKVFELQYGIGVTNYTQNESIRDIMSRTDKSFLNAMQKENCHVNYLEGYVEFTKQEWIERLEWAFNNDGIKFISQSILNAKVSTVHMKEYFFRLEDKNNKVYRSFLAK
mgnify:CR=1 FL=1